MGQLLQEPCSTLTNASACLDLQETEMLIHDVRSILVHAQEDLVNGEAKEHVEKLEQWIESYRRGLAAAQKISTNGTAMLQVTRDKLKLALEEQLRLEDEGGNPATREQSSKIDQLIKTVRRLDRLIPVVEQSFQARTQEMEDA